MDRFVFEDFKLSVIADNDRKSLSCYLTNKDGVVISSFAMLFEMEYYLKAYFGFVENDENK